MITYANDSSASELDQIAPDLPRYAIYFTPEPNHALWQHASEWLGRDAYTDQALTQPHLDFVDLATATQSPRFYGFHATLKAPFELVDHLKEDHLVAHAEVFAAERNSFEIEVEPAEIGSFLALRLTGENDTMTNLHHRCVIEFDLFRAPLTRFDIQRRNTSAMSARQKEYFMSWGYPYVFDEFRFHMTLTGSIRDSKQRQHLLAELKQRFPTSSLAVNGIAVYYQPDRHTPFKVLRRFQFS